MDATLFLFVYFDFVTQPMLHLIPLNLLATSYTVHHPFAFDFLFLVVADRFDQVDYLAYLRQAQPEEAAVAQTVELEDDGTDGANDHSEKGNTLAINERILREVKTLSRLEHEHVVRYYQAWVEGGEQHVESWGGENGQRTRDYDLSQTLSRNRDNQNTNNKAQEAEAKAHSSPSRKNMSSSGSSAGSSSRFSSGGSSSMFGEDMSEETSGFGSEITPGAFLMHSDSSVTIIIYQ